MQKTSADSSKSRNESFERMSESTEKLHVLPRKNANRRRLRLSENRKKRSFARNERS